MVGFEPQDTTCQCGKTWLHLIANVYIFDHIFALHFARCDHVFAFPDLSWSFQRCVIFLFYRALPFYFWCLILIYFIYLYAKRGLRRHRWVKLSVDETTGRRKFDTSSVERRATQVEATSSLEPLLRAAEASDAAVLLGEAQRIARNRNHWFLIHDWFTWIMDDFNFPFCKDTFHMQCMIHMISTYSI